MDRIGARNGLRDETGALIGGLVVFDYIAGMADYKAGNSPPDMTSPSYDLGRQRAAEETEADADFRRNLAEQEEQTEARMRSILPPDIFAEYQAKIAEIRDLQKP